MCCQASLGYLSPLEMVHCPQKLFAAANVFAPQICEIRTNLVFENCEDYLKDVLQLSFITGEIMGLGTGVVC